MKFHFNIKKRKVERKAQKGVQAQDQAIAKQAVGQVEEVGRAAKAAIAAAEPVRGMRIFEIPLQPPKGHGFVEYHESLDFLAAENRAGSPDKHFLCWNVTSLQVHLANSKLSKQMSFSPGQRSQQT